MYSLVIHGRRSLELQKWRNLRVSVKLLQNVFAFSDSFSSATAAADISLRDGRKGKTFTVSYLVESLGLTKKLAQSISRKVSFEEKRNPDSVLNLFKSYGFTDSQISSIISDYPSLLILDAEKSLGPKLQFLQSMKGASSSELTEIVSKVPKMLGMKEDKTTSRYYDFVKEVIEADKISKFEKVCHSLPEGSKQENVIRNVLALRELGVPQRLLFPLLLSVSPIVCGKEKFEESLKKVVEMGFDPTTAKFIHALQVVYKFSGKTIEGKIQVYQRFGFAVEDVWAIFKKWPNTLAISEKNITQKFETLKNCGLLDDEVSSVFKRFPQCIGVSEQSIWNSVETFLGLGFSRDEFVMIVKNFPQCIGLSGELVRKKTEFLVKKMNWPLKAVVSVPAVFGYSLEKRTVPRCNVIQALMVKGLIGSELPPMASVLVCTDDRFLKRYVMKHDGKELVTELMSIFTGERRTNVHKDL